jgi:hypothetical protein
MSGPLDFTNQNIENTYQRVLQTDGTIVYDGTGSVFPIGANIANTIDANITVGGIPSGTNFPAGTSIEDIIRELLVTYIAPSISGLRLRNGGSDIPTTSRDVGASFTIDAVIFRADPDSPGGLYPASASFTSTGAEGPPINYYFGDNILADSNTLSIGSTYTITRNTAGSVSFAVTAKRQDTGATVGPTTTSVAFQFRNYLAASTIEIASDSDAQSVIDNGVVTSQLDTDRAWTAVCGAANNDNTKYTYIIYPASYGNLTFITQNGSLPVLGGFEDPQTFTILNTNGASVPVKVYKSRQPGPYASGVVLAIS